MKRSTLTILVLFAALSAITAQGDFTNGYIIKNDGNLVYGQVAYIAKGYTPKECVFRWFDISEVYTFLPGDIEAFGFTYGMRYKSAVIDGKKVFIACLTEGILDLLFDGNTMYLDGMGLEVVPLGNTGGSVNAEGKMLSFNNYRDLIENLPDPENKFSVPANISLKPEIMREAIADYNKSRGSHTTVFSMKNPSAIFEGMKNQGAFFNNFGVTAGVNASRYAVELSTSVLGTKIIPQMDFFEKTPVIGLLFNHSLIRGNDNLYLQTEIMAFKTNVYFYNEYYLSLRTYRTDINIGYTGIKVPVSFKVNFLNGNFRPFVHAGGFLMFNLFAKYTREGETETSDNIVRTFTDNSISLYKSIMGVHAGVGMKINIRHSRSIFGEFRCEYGSGLYDIALDQKTLSYNIIAGFTFPYL